MSSLQNKKSILLADDEPDLRGILRDTLLQNFRNIAILEARDGAEAFQKLKNQVFDVAVVDLSMPKMAGRQILKSLSTLPEPQRPKQILIYSGFSSSAEIKAEYGNHIHFIAKPASAQALIDFFSQALGIQKPSGPKMDLVIVNTFIESVLEVLKTMAGVQSKKEALFIRGNDLPSGDISALISVVTPLQKGSMAISFEEKCFLYVLSALLPHEKHAEITPENGDAAAELCNQIFGITKRRLNELGWEISPAIPNVILGKNHSIQHKANGPCIAVRFSTPAGYFTVETALQKVG
jgi:chemotaxis protein CheX